MPELDVALCPRYHRAVEIIGRRWSGAILRVMLDGATRFSQIKHAVPDITDRMLSERLKELEGQLAEYKKLVGELTFENNAMKNFIEKKL